jgi:hypothetical protein
MFKEYKESQTPTPTLATEVIAHTENSYRDNSTFEEILSSLSFEVGKNIPSTEAIEKLSQSDNLIADKVNILLAALGEKPSSVVVYVSEEWQDGEEEEHISAERTATMLDLARSLELHVCTRDTIEHESHTGLSRNRRAFSLSLSQHNAEILNEVFWTKDTAEELILGKVLGFPDTAVAAYAAQDGMIPVDQLQHETLDDKLFIQFRMSAENADAEIQTVRRWARAVKEADVLLYNQVKLARA